MAKPVLSWFLAAHSAGHSPWNFLLNEDMSRGWESKSVEEQQPGAFANPAADSSKNTTNEEQRRVADRERAAHDRRRQALNLQRENIPSQRTSNPGRRAALEAALEQIDAQIRSLG